MPPFTSFMCGFSAGRITGLIGMLCFGIFMPPIGIILVPPMRVRSGFEAPLASGAIFPMPTSASVRIGRTSIGGIGARMPDRVASVPLAKPLRPRLCAKIV